MGAAVAGTARPVSPLGSGWRSVLFVAACIGLASCSGKPARAPSDTAGAAVASDEVGEPHDQSAFAKDPSQIHLMSPDEPDLHPQPEPGRPEAR